MMIDERFFKAEREGPILWLILNRPEVRNRMPLAFFDALVPAFASIDADPEIRVVVIRAEGPCFTVGLDLADAGPEILGDGSASAASGSGGEFWSCRDPAGSSTGAACPSSLPSTATASAAAST